MIMYKVGDIIKLDCGYGPHEDIQECTILNIDASFNVFREPIWDIKIKTVSGEIFNTDKPRNPAEQMKYKNDFKLFLKDVQQRINPWRLQNDLSEITEEEAKKCFNILARLGNE